MSKTVNIPFLGQCQAKCDENALCQAFQYDSTGNCEEWSFESYSGNIVSQNCNVIVDNAAPVYRTVKTDAESGDAETTIS